MCDFSFFYLESSQYALQSISTFILSAYMLLQCSINKETKHEYTKQELEELNKKKKINIIKGPIGNYFSDTTTNTPGVNLAVIIAIK